MLNLGIINSGGSYQDVSLEEVQASQLAYMEAEQHLTDYMNYVEVLEGLQRHSSTECLAFASELLGIPTGDIHGVSQEEFEQHISMEGAGVWGTFRKLWNDFCSWIRGLWRRLIALFSKQEGKSATSSGATAANTASAAPSKTTEKEAPAPKQYNKFSSVPKSTGYTPAGKAVAEHVEKTDRKHYREPKTKKDLNIHLTLVANHTDASMNSFIGACDKASSSVNAISTGKSYAIEQTTTDLVKEIARFSKEHKSRSYGLTGLAAVKYIRSLEKVLNSINALVDKIYKLKDNRGNVTAPIAKSQQRVRNIATKFISTLTREFKAYSAKEHEVNENVAKWYRPTDLDYPKKAGSD